jgi:hypothetical protein
VKHPEGVVDSDPVWLVTAPHCQRNEFVAEIACARAATNMIGPRKVKFSARLSSVATQTTAFSASSRLCFSSQLRRGPQISMALKLFIPSCIHNPRHCLHPPPPPRPLRIQIQGPLESIQKLLPDISWDKIVDFPQPGGLELASLTYQALYGEEGSIPAVRDEYLVWAMEGRRLLE